MVGRLSLALLVLLVAAGAAACLGQEITGSQLVLSGQVRQDGRELQFRIRRLPVNAFPDLPGPVAAALEERGCLIPQTYEAHRPENVIHGSLERAGSSDWAVLCSVKGKVSLLVFFASASPTEPVVLAERLETERLQEHDLTGVLGFNWGIDPASPGRIHEAQASMRHRPAPPDHDCVADSTIDHKTIYHLYRNGAWERVEVDSD